MHQARPNRYLAVKELAPGSCEQFNLLALLLALTSKTALQKGVNLCVRGAWKMAPEVGFGAASLRLKEGPSE
jgi:hypothetical protein